MAEPERRRQRAEAWTLESVVRSLWSAAREEWASGQVRKRRPTLAAELRSTDFDNYARLVALPPSCTLASSHASLQGIPDAAAMVESHALGHGARLCAEFDCACEP